MRIMRAIIFSSLTGLFLSSCISTNYMYSLDGSPSGKGNAQGFMSISFGSSRDFDVTLDENDKPNGIIIKDEASFIPLLGMSGEYGLTDRIDVGIAASLGALTGSVSIFSQFCLTDTNSAFGASLVPRFTFGGGPDSLWIFELEQQYTNRSMELLFPLHMQLSAKTRFVMTPILGREKFSIEYAEEGPFHGRAIRSDWFTKRGINLGVQVKFKDSMLFPQVTLININQGTQWFPVYGISVKM